MDEARHTRARRESLVLNGFQILFAAVGLLQAMMKQGYEGIGVGEGKMKIISLFVSISLFAFAAAVVLPLRYTDILCRISFFFLVLASKPHPRTTQNYPPLLPLLLLLVKSNGKCSWERGSFKRSREQFVSGSTLCSTGSIIIYEVTCNLVESNLLGACFFFCSTSSEYAFARALTFGFESPFKNSSLRSE
ncbi:hypothetical protein MRB53_031957 [Persea americana]|uniref:Uncharacterized protein n=1 Tax=Persea americana TaxID=3435 RepID=A0ACC2KR33_PERAE|nr:hypothetical protein MRB53_031957 [Persea americana]